MSFANQHHGDLASVISLHRMSEMAPQAQVYLFVEDSVRKPVVQDLLPFNQDVELQPCRSITQDASFGPLILPPARSLPQPSQ